ncbi:hypothetical protein Vadar_026298 [Vaccinium darrowii]|uniref:Uncharacterized protein n=1 Tax=Vaccinium darrowii TaxID=229202 RepID=A0ACB7XCL1_9ERIC|nr:hypothetical protein Vadar_026298 [Vaccinium darrowii]
MRDLARAIERFGEIYQRVEGEKQRQVIELEKQRMQFAKDLEVQRMQLFMDTQVRLEKIKQAKRSGSNGDNKFKELKIISPPSRSWVLLPRAETAEQWTIYPWIHSNCNSLSVNDQLRRVSIPDIHPAKYSF